MTKLQITDRAADDVQWTLSMITNRYTDQIDFWLMFWWFLDSPRISRLFRVLLMLSDIIRVMDHHWWSIETSIIRNNNSYSQFDHINLMKLPWYQLGNCVFPYPPRLRNSPNDRLIIFWFRLPEEQICSNRLFYSFRLFSSTDSVVQTLQSPIAIRPSLC